MSSSNAGETIYTIWDRLQGKLEVLSSLKGGDKLNVYDDGSFARGDRSTYMAAAWTSLSRSFRNDASHGNVAAVKKLVEETCRVWQLLPRKTSDVNGLIHRASEGLDRLAKTYKDLGREAERTAFAMHARHLRSVTNITRHSPLLVPIS